jgi:hypothetical protein
LYELFVFQVSDCKKKCFFLKLNVIIKKVKIEIKSLFFYFKFFGYSVFSVSYCVFVAFADFEFFEHGFFDFPFGYSLLVGRCVLLRTIQI